MIFDLDGTLVDSVYQHVAAWHAAFTTRHLVLPQWRIHRAIGMSGRLFLPKLLGDEGHRAPRGVIASLEKWHDKTFSSLIRTIEPLPGSTELLRFLKRKGIPFAIATSGNKAQTKRLLRLLTPETDLPVVTADDVPAAKPAPDLFELAAAKLDKLPQDCFVVGDSVWDVLAGRRINASVVALRTGGFDGAELQSSGAYRVYDDPLELTESLAQLGFDFNEDARS